MLLRARIGRNVRTHRRHQKLSQERLAELVDRSVDAISAIERGVMPPSIDTLDRIASALEIPVRALFEGDDATERVRSELMARLMAAAHRLKDPDLEVAVKQVEALAGRR
jgi:transcriptional regulator with XRE-family HTH domain